jgi:hypothetical protein
MLRPVIGYGSSLPAIISTPLEIKSEVVFGSPSQNCLGTGICMVMHRLPRLYTIRCPHASAWFSYEEGGLLLRFPKHRVQDEKALTLFESPWFWVEECFKLPLYMSRRLLLPSTWGAAGLYRIEQDRYNWYINVGLTAENDRREPSAKC